MTATVNVTIIIFKMSRLREILLRIESPLRKRRGKAAFLFVLAVLLLLKMHNEPVFQRFLKGPVFEGDENKYMRMVQSLAADGDLDLSNLWFEKEDMRAVWKDVLSSGSRRFGDFYFLARNGGIYALHMPGVAFLLVPAYKLDSMIFPGDPKKALIGLPFLPAKLLFTLLWLASLALMNFALFLRLIDRLFDSPFLAAGLFFLLIYSSPFPNYAFTVFPGCSATFFFLLGLNVVLFPFRSRSINDGLAVVAMAFLPWLHQRFIPLAGGLFLAFLIQNRMGRSSARRILRVSLGLVVLSLPYFYYFYVLTGNLSPLSSSEFFGRVHFTPRVVPIGFFALLFSPSQGTVWRSPWIIFCFFGIYWAFKKDRGLTFSLLIPAILYYLTCAGSTILGGGMSPPGRFLVPLFPVFLVFIGFMLQDLYKEFSSSRLAFYLAFLALFIFARGMLAFHFADRYAKPPYYNYVFTEPLDPVWVVESVAILAGIFLSIFLSDRFLFARKRSLGKE